MTLTQFLDRLKELDALREDRNKLKKILARELTENDELGSEFVYVQELKRMLTDSQARELALRLALGIYARKDEEARAEVGYADKVLSATETPALLGVLREVESILIGGAERGGVFWREDAIQAIRKIIGEEK